MKNQKILIAYFSRKGMENTSKSAKVAEKAAELLKAKGVDFDTFAVVPVEEYPEDNTLLEMATKAERDRHARPSLTSKYSGMKYITGVLLISPNWWDSMPQGMFTFLDEYDFAETRVVPVIVTKDDAKNVRMQVRGFLRNWVLDGVDVPENEVGTPEGATKVEEAVAQLFQPSESKY